MEIAVMASLLAKWNVDVYAGHAAKVAIAGYTLFR